jgi:hypothetical protein
VRRMDTSPSQHNANSAVTTVTRFETGRKCFSWQEGYSSLSFSRSHRKRIIQYVTHQKFHHDKNELWDEWEETDEVAPEEKIL